MEDTKDKDKDKDKVELPLLQVVLNSQVREDPLLIGTEVGEALEGRELEKLVDEDLQRFSTFYRKTLGNDELSSFEKAAIKTYLWWKTHPSA